MTTNPTPEERIDRLEAAVRDLQERIDDLERRIADHESDHYYGRLETQQ